MKTSAVLDPLIDQLLAALDREISLLDIKHSQMVELYRTIVDRDDPAMERLLNAMEKAQTQQAMADMALAAVRSSLSEAIGKPVRELKLANLIHILPDGPAAELSARREHLRAAADRLRRQHMRTSLLLYESARLNRMMLECLAGSPEVTTYDAQGTNGWRAGSLLDTRL